MSLLRTTGDFESLRVAREHMYQAIAVPEDMWAEWIKDELDRPGALHDPSAIKRIVQLYTRATQEYTIVTAWQDYIAFVNGLSDSQDEATRSAAIEAFGGTEYVLPVLQSAIDATEAHYQDSQAIWIQYKDHIERAIDAAESSGDAGVDVSELVGLLQAIFLERLGRPHAALEATFALYSQFITRYRNDAYEQHMVEANNIVSQTRQLCAVRDSCEDGLAASTGDWDAFVSYIEMLMREKACDTKEIGVVYERGLVSGRYSPASWDEYITFLASSTHSMQASVKVAGRAIRNCPWSGKLWAQLVLLTYSESGLAAAMEVYTRAVSTHAVDYSMFEYSLLAMARISAVRLQHRSDQLDDASTLQQVCADCLDAVYKLDLRTADPTLSLERLCTSVTAEYLLDADTARKMWTRICKARRDCTEAWILSTEFERVHGSEVGARSVFRHASQRRLDNPERLFDAWIAFERACGSLPDYYSAEQAIALRRHLIRRRTKREVHANLSCTLVTNSSVESMPAQKRQRVSDQEQQLSMEVPTASTVGCNYTNNPPAGAPVQSNVVFVNNLPPSFSSHDVEKLLGGRTNVSKVTMLETKQGATRGQARADLSSVGALIAALDKNGLRVDGHFVSIHVFNPSRHSRVSEKPTTVEVRGVSPDTSNRQIEQEVVSGKASAPIRVHRSRQGDVVFVVMKKSDAQQAVDILHGCSIDGRVLSARIAEANADTFNADVSAPKPTRASAMVEPAPTLRAAASAMVPRKAAAKRPSKKVALSATKPTAIPLNTDSTNVAGTKSNSDFRQLFLESNNKNNIGDVE
ncbi:Splicing factor [Coemansia sp. RSA 2322]|nr:Splicing factor [Coemansia sp. RSA 2322]